MKEVKLASVALENTAYSFDKEYSYIIKEEMIEDAQVGCRVLVNFGKGSSKRQGVIVDITSGEKQKNMKYILAVLDKAPLVSGEMIELAYYLKRQTFCTLYEAIKLSLPTGINLKTTINYLANVDKCDQIYDLNAEEKQIYEYLLNKNKYVKQEKILKDLGFNKDSTLLESLYKKEFVFKNYDTVRRVNDASVKMMRLILMGDNLESVYSGLTKKQKSVVDLLKDVGSASVKEICYFTGVTTAVVNALVNKGIAELYENEVLRNPYKNKTQVNTEEITLTSHQQKVYENLLNQYKQEKSSVSLLFGVTGSGKTQVYLKLIDDVLKEGRGIIVMVPEISLTPQILNIFHLRYGNKVAVFHSGLSLGERMDEWKRVKRGDAKIAVGTRSSVFAPIDDIGLIIMDEEQEHTYKSECSPRYNARDVAKFRCYKNDGLLVLASATPSFESYKSALDGRYTLNCLEERYGNASLPEVITVDMTSESANGNKTQISKELYESLVENLKNKHQSILLMNRRGYNTYVSCGSCGEVVTCPNCSISMTYHAANDRLMCHYCGYSKPFTNVCESCGEQDVIYLGYGTQRVEDELRSLIPDAKILRMDTDTTMSKFSHEKKLDSFANGKYDIMIGTQMVAKGLDFENVTLVGVLNADQRLYDDNYKSLELTFDLLTQVVGRAGRGKYKGKAIIQTSVPDNEVIKLAAKQDYKTFYKMETVLRKSLIYPPYCDICVIGFVGINEAKVSAASKLFLDNFKNILTKYTNQKVVILGPLPSKVKKVSNKYRYRLLVKCSNTKEFRTMMSELYIKFGKNVKFRDVSTIIDINPNNIL